MNRQRGRRHFLASWLLNLPAPCFLATKKAGGSLRPDKMAKGVARGSGREEVVAGVLDRLVDGALVAGGQVGVPAGENLAGVGDKIAEGLRRGEGQLVGREGARCGGFGRAHGWEGRGGKGAQRGVVNLQSAVQLWGGGRPPASP